MELTDSGDNREIPEAVDDEEDRIEVDADEEESDADETLDMVIKCKSLHKFCISFPQNLVSIISQHFVLYFISFCCLAFVGRRG